MATRRNNTNNQIPSAERDETNDNNPNLRSALVPNGYHGIKLTSDKLYDNINRTVLPLTGNILKSATAGKLVALIPST